MPLWGNSDSAANSVKYATELTRGQLIGSGSANKAANNTKIYANTTVGGFTPGVATGQFMVTAQEFANTSAKEKTFVPHLGWNMRHQYTGPIVSYAIGAGGTGYSNTDTIRVSGGTINATATLTTNSTGGIATITPTNPGAGFMNVSTSTLAVINSTAGASAGSGATINISLGGRAGRVVYETIVAGGSGTSTGNTIPANT